MRARCLFAVVICLLAGAGVPARAQFQGDAPRGKPGEIVTQRWRIGVVISAEGSGFQKIEATTTVPIDWPDQRVRVVDEDKSPGVTWSYKPFPGAASQMVVKIPSLGENEEASAVLTFEVRRMLAPPPEATDEFTLPASSKSNPKIGPFLVPSLPYIESDHPEIKKLSQQITADRPKAWQKVEAIYDWVREHVTYQDNRLQKPKRTLKTLADGTGDCDEMTSLFIAFCRAGGVPARMVRVPNHVYPEFYLLDQRGTGRWFPCQASGTRAFGGIPDGRPILQRGDNILAPDPSTRKKTRHRILPDNLTGVPLAPGGNLKFKRICEPAA